MPPRAIWSSVVDDHRERVEAGRRVGPLPAPRRCWSSRKTRLTGSGNLGRRGFSGLKPKPPYSGSNCSASCARPCGGELARRGARGRVAGAGERAADDRRRAGRRPSRSRPAGRARPRRRRLSTLEEALEAVAVLGREVGAAEERPAVGGQEHRHRPAAAVAEGLQRGHVDLVDVGPLLAVDLDAHEMLVEEPGDLRVHEALALHDVAPVARAVADRQEDRLVLGLGPGERLGAPGIPVDRVVGVEQQVGAGLPGQPVGRRLGFRFGRGRAGPRGSG